MMLCYPASLLCLAINDLEVPAAALSSQSKREPPKDAESWVQLRGLQGPAPGTARLQLQTRHSGPAPKPPEGRGDNRRCPTQGPGCAPRGWQRPRSAPPRHKMSPCPPRRRLTGLMLAGPVGQLDDQQLPALGAAPHRVDPADGRALQPHGHQRLPQLGVAVVLEGDALLGAQPPPPAGAARPRRLGRPAGNEQPAQSQQQPSRHPHTRVQAPAGPAGREGRTDGRTDGGRGGGRSRGSRRRGRAAQPSPAGTCC